MDSRTLNRRVFVYMSVMSMNEIWDVMGMVSWEVLDRGNPLEYADCLGYLDLWKLFPDFSERQEVGGILLRGS